MPEIFKLIEIYGTQLAAISAAIAGIWGGYKFLAERKVAQFWKEFEVYHKLVKELVQPSAETDGMYIDRQTAIIYELRFYKRYYQHSERMLKSLRKKWLSSPEQYPRIIEELDLTVEYISKKRLRSI
jgi:hypothetical protein